MCSFETKLKRRACGNRGHVGQCFIARDMGRFRIPAGMIPKWQLFVYWASTARAPNAIYGSSQSSGALIQTPNIGVAVMINSITRSPT